MNRNSYLVQRLHQPHNMKIAGVLVDNPFSFGGGYKNGGLSDEAMGLMRSIFSFDYKGAAEFEWGAVPEAFRTIAKNIGKFQATVIDIPLSDVAPSWKDKNPAPKGNGRVYILCASDDATEVEKRIRAWASDSKDREYRTKERVCLNTSLRPYDEWDNETQGWLELDNGFMFFTDRLMWERTAALFGIETAVAA